MGGRQILLPWGNDGAPGQVTLTPLLYPTRSPLHPADTIIVLFVVRNNWKRGGWTKGGEERPPQKALSVSPRLRHWSDCVTTSHCPATLTYTQPSSQHSSSAAASCGYPVYPTYEIKPGWCRATAGRVREAKMPDKFEIHRDQQLFLARTATGGATYRHAFQKIDKRMSEDVRKSI